MTRNHRLIVWICLAACLLMMLPGLMIRLGNENGNKSVVTAVEYNEFFKAANKAHLDFDGLLEQLKDMGVTAMAVKETTIADLIYMGHVYASSAGELLSRAKSGFSSAQSGLPPGKSGISVLPDQVMDFIGGDKVNPSSRLFITDRADTAAFLRERLGRRFDSGQFSVLEFDGKTLFLMKTEIDEKYEVGLGFEENVLKKLKDKGFEILLRPRNSPGASYEYLTEYDRLIGDFGIRYVVFDGSKLPGSPDKLDSMVEIIRKHNVIAGIIETPSQIGYVEQLGLDRLIADTGYAINRVYIAPESYLQRLDKEELFYQWMRGVVDRNIRIVYINPLRITNSTFLDNVNNTLYAIKLFNDFISSKGYAIDKPLVKLSAQMPSAFHYFISSLSLIFGGLLYLSYLLDRRFRLKHALVLAALGAAFSFILNFVLGFGLEKLYALAAAILYPTFSTLLLLRYLRDNKGNGAWIENLFVSLVIIIGTNAIGAYSVVSVLSDIRYIMNVELFRGVLVSFAVPVMLYAVNFLFCFAEYGKVRNYIARIAGSKVTYLAAAIGVIGALAFFIYLARSGNTMGVSASSLELRMRELFEKTLVARPRLKEFLIAYPALFAMVYLYKRYQREEIPFLFGIGAVIGSVSIVNSFCHVFTAVSVSALRTLYGLIIGVVLGALSVAVLAVLLNAYKKLFRLCVNMDRSN